MCYTLITSHPFILPSGNPKHTRRPYTFLKHNLNREGLLFYLFALKIDKLVGNSILYLFIYLIKLNKHISIKTKQDNSNHLDNNESTWELKPKDIGIQKSRYATKHKPSCRFNNIYNQTLSPRMQTGDRPLNLGARMWPNAYPRSP